MSDNLTNTATKGRANGDAEWGRCHRDHGEFGRNQMELE